MEIIVEHELELADAAKKLINSCPGFKVFAFSGEMGSGKTTFIKAICKHLGSSDHFSSPSYSVINLYSLADSSQICHIDLYRISDLKEALDLGITEYLDSGDYCFIEWPEILKPILSKDYVDIEISVLNSESRKFSIHCHV
jgi:tRNA threonylcarbamoyladenosine biosynthesis protein TsaE